MCFIDWQIGLLIFFYFFFEGGEIPVPSKSELDQLQEEVARRAQEQELRRKREKEMEAAMGFNPHPSRFMDLDELQNQGNSYELDKAVGMGVCFGILCQMWGK